MTEIIKKIREKMAELKRILDDWCGFLIFIFFGILILYVGYKLSLRTGEMVPVGGLYLSLVLLLYSIAVPTVSIQILSGNVYYKQNYAGGSDLPPEKLYDTRVIVENASRFPGRFYINLNLKVNENPVSAPDLDLYSGKKPWRLFPRRGIHGHFSFERFIKDLDNSKILTMDIEVWNAGISKYIIKYPVQHWNFDFNRNLWHLKEFGLDT